MFDKMVMSVTPGEQQRFMKKRKTEVREALPPKEHSNNFPIQNRGLHNIIIEWNSY